MLESSVELQYFYNFKLITKMCFRFQLIINNRNNGQKHNCFKIFVIVVIKHRLQYYLYINIYCKYSLQIKTIQLIIYNRNNEENIILSKYFLWLLLNIGYNIICVSIFIANIYCNERITQRC